MFKHHPITGVGLKNFHIACEYEKFISIEHKKYNITPWWGITKERIEESTLNKNNEKGNILSDLKIEKQNYLSNKQKLEDEENRFSIQKNNFKNIIKFIHIYYSIYLL